MVKVSDYIFSRLAALGVRHLFMVVGGGAMHLNDSVGRCAGLRYVCNHHEQACAIAAEGYARASGKLGVACVTTGPGGTNTLTGVIGQWLDSVPVLYVSGQVKLATSTLSCPELGLRQLGDQEIDIAGMVRPVTKLAATLRDPREIGRLLDKAVAVATTGRPGPVWLDVPVDVQGALVDEKDLPAYDPREDAPARDEERLRGDVARTLAALRGARRPVVVAGHGIRIAGAQRRFLELAGRMAAPVVTTFNGFDLVPSDHPCFVGRIGTVGDRAGNFALQNADVVLFLGTRNNIRQVSYAWQWFARAAVKIVVDIDEKELRKPTLRPDIPVCADAADFLEELDRQAAGALPAAPPGWLAWCAERRRRYPVVLPSYAAHGPLVQPYYFTRALTAQLGGDAVVVAGDGTACVSLFQAGVVKGGQRMFWNSGCAAMGFDLPAAIGASFACGGRGVVCLAGDGSLQMNIQELQTVAHHRLPLKLFYLDNRGYVSIRQTQDAFFKGRHVGSDEESGVSFPDIVRVAEAYGLPAATIDSHEGIEETIARVLAREGPCVCRVSLSPDHVFSPKLSSETRPDGTIVSKPLEDMYPFLDREEFLANMLIEPLP